MTIAPASHEVGAPPQVATDPLPPRRARLRLDRIGLYGLLSVAALTALFPLLWMLSGSLQGLTRCCRTNPSCPPRPSGRTTSPRGWRETSGVCPRNNILYTASRSC